MSAYGGGDHTAGGFTATVDAGAINVTGTDLAIVAAAVETGGADTTATFVWDPTGNNESMGNIHDLGIASGYLDMDTAYIDDPTSANAVVRVTFGEAIDETAIIATWFTGAANIVTADVDSDSTDTASPYDVSVPNVGASDLTVDFIAASDTSPPTLTVGGSQTQRFNAANGNYTQFACSTRAGNGAMSWTCSPSNPVYGVIQAGIRIPDSGGGGGGGASPLLTPLRKRPLMHLLRR